MEAWRKRKEGRKEKEKDKKNNYRENRKREEGKVGERKKERVQRCSIRKWKVESYQPADRVTVEVTS